jgi:hypothetical protein
VTHHDATAAHAAAVPAAADAMDMPDGDGTTAGPTFEYVEPELRR